jgi:hypothetical protein
MYPDQDTQNTNGYGGYPDEFLDSQPFNTGKKGFRLSAWKSLLGVLILGYVVSLATCRGPQSTDTPQAPGPTNNFNIDNLTPDQLGNLAEQMGVEVEDLNSSQTEDAEPQAEVYQVYSDEYINSVYQARETVEAELHRWARCRAASIHGDVVNEINNTPGVTSAQDVFIQKLQIIRNNGKAAADGQAFYRHTADAADAFRDPAMDAHALLLLLTAFTQPEPAVPLCQQDAKHFWNQVDQVIAEYQKSSPSFRTIGGATE